ncbi:MAG: hypothetical protein FJ102_08465 [Deltaproteobacteria bacterium]|nr:hypothetical protein [Deltaproteobacteria bacterium]
MRALPLLFLAACPQDTGFQSGTDTKISGGNGVIVVTPSYVLFEGLQPSYAKSASFNVASTGEEQLQVYQARLIANPGGVFTFEDKSDVLINPGDSVDWDVALYTTEEGKFEGAIRIESNDGSTPEVVVELCGATTGWSEPCGSGEDSGVDSE